LGVSKPATIVLTKRRHPDEAAQAVQAGGTGQTRSYRWSLPLDTLVRNRIAYLDLVRTNGTIVCPRTDDRQTYIRRRNFHLVAEVGTGRWYRRIPPYRCPLKLLTVSLKFNIISFKLVRAGGTGGSHRTTVC
jgi:hypothetical protein